MILDLLLLGKIKFPGVCLVGRAEALSRGVLSVLNDPVQVDSHATTPAYACLKLLTDKLRCVRVPVEIPCPSGLLSVLCNSPRKFEKSLLKSDFRDFINYLNFGKKKRTREGS